MKSPKRGHPGLSGRRKAFTRAVHQARLETGRAHLFVQRLCEAKVSTVPSLSNLSAGKCVYTYVIIYVYI